MVSKKILFILLTLVIIFIFVRYLIFSEFFSPKATSQNDSTENELIQWQVFINEGLEYELKYPKDWGFAKQGDGFVDFGPGNPKPVAGKIALDMQCLYGTQTKIYGENTEEELKNVIFGKNQYIEKKIYVVSAKDRILSFQNYTMQLPKSYTGNTCKTASFIVRDYDLEENIRTFLLSSFRVETR